MLTAARVAIGATTIMIGGAWMITHPPSALPPGYYTLSDYQAACAQAHAVLIQTIPLLYPSTTVRVRLGEAHRTKWQAAYNKMIGVGIENSLHIDRLAVDYMIDLHINGQWVYQDGSNKESVAPYAKACGAWKYIGANWSPSFPAACGYEFKDPGHFSCAARGTK